MFAFNEIKNRGLKMDKTVAQTALKASEVFNNFEEDQLGLLNESGQTRRFSKGEDIYEKGSESHGTFCLIVSGSVEIVSENGQILQRMGANEVIGEVGTISPQNKRTITVRATEPVEALEWDLASIEDNFPELLKRLKDLAWKRITNWYE
jgi:CRP-like cAMP-binding protein